MWSSGSILVALDVSPKCLVLAVIFRFFPSSWNHTACFPVSVVNIWHLLVLQRIPSSFAHCVAVSNSCCNVSLSVVCRSTLFANIVMSQFVFVVCGTVFWVPAYSFRLYGSCFDKVSIYKLSRIRLRGEPWLTPLATASMLRVWYPCVWILIVCNEKHTASCKSVGSDPVVMFCSRSLGTRSYAELKSRTALHLCPL